MSEQGTDAIKAALRRRGASMRCPACEWTLEGPLDGYRLMADGDDPLGVGAGGIELMVFVCRNCGYVRLHSANVAQTDPVVRPPQ